MLLCGSLGVSFATAGLRHSPAHQRTVAFALLVPVIGDALLALATIVGLGALFHYVVDERNRDPQPVPIHS
jgi:hypothetical protein